MEYSLITDEKRFGGLTRTKPEHDNWTLKPYLGGLIKEFWNGDDWIESANNEDIAEVIKASVPNEVQLWRVRTVLKLMGLEETIAGALEQLEEPTKTGAKTIWEYGTTIERQSQTVKFLQYVLQMTDGQVDEIFIQAEAIEI